MQVDAEAVTVKLASRSERIVIECLSQFYMYDFSEMEPTGSGKLEFDDQGSYPSLPSLDSYWRLEGFWPLLIHLGQSLVGFALINTHSHRGGSVEHNMDEFFVARKYRGRGVAAEAVRRIFLQYPGCWEIAVAARNVRALAFWSHTLAKTPNVCHLVLHEGDSAHWRGPIWSFTAVASN